MIVGGAIGSAMVIVIVAVLFISPPSALKPDITITNEDTPSALAEISSVYSKKLSLIEIFEKSEPGVVRVNVQRNDTGGATGGVG